MSMTAPDFNERNDKKGARKGISWNIPMAGKGYTAGQEGGSINEKRAFKNIKKCGHLSERRGSSTLSSTVEKTQKISGIIGASPAIRSIFNIIQKVARTSSSVLINGESGTGKELVARAVHNSSASGASSPFIAINCGALPAGLMESELFGHERGAFTGASAKKVGKAELAEGGTLFLDEIAAMPLNLQVKLLRFIQERTFTRVGGNIPVKVNLRIIAAANTDLREAVRRGEFREDLFYRLNVIPLLLPPLRDRGGDILLLAKFFLHKYSEKYSRPCTTLSFEALNALEVYDWPGNVRELENIMERLVVLAPDEGLISKSALPGEIISAVNKRPLTPENFVMPSASDFKGAVRAFERSYITNLLYETGWNRVETARLMRVHRNTLLQKMKTLHISRADEDKAEFCSPLASSETRRAS